MSISLPPLKISALESQSSNEHWISQLHQGLVRLGAGRDCHLPDPHPKGQFSLVKRQNSTWAHWGLYSRAEQRGSCSAGRVQSLQPCFNSLAFPVSFPAGQRCRHSGHPGGAAAPVLRQHGQHESEECEKVRAEFCTFRVFPGLLVLLCWVLAVVLQCRALSNNLWWWIFSRATKIRVGSLSYWNLKLGMRAFAGSLSSFWP